MSDDGGVTILQGDCRSVLRQLPAESVHCCVTSPPYWGLRDYGTADWEGGDPGCDHIAERKEPVIGSSSTLGIPSDGGKRWITEGNNYHEAYTRQFRDTCGKCGARRVDRQIGLEPTPEAHIAALLEVFREVRRVLRPDGTLWCNYGDCYACAPNGRKAADVENDDRTFRDKPFSTVTQRKREELTGGGCGSLSTRDVSARSTSAPNLKPKDLVGMPWRLALALQADGWWLRSDIIWSKPNPMPSSVVDRPTMSHEYLFLLTKSARYFYDADAIREKTGREADPEEYAAAMGGNKGADADRYGAGYRKHSTALVHPSGRNRRSVWEIATQPTPDAHFATFPQALVEPCILAGTSERGCCPQCGAGWRRVVEKNFVRQPDVSEAKGIKGHANQKPMYAGAWEGVPRGSVDVKTTGWAPTCAHTYTEAELVPATVLDPFAGSGTVAKVATKLGRRSIGIELNPAYIEIAHRKTAQRGLEI